MEALKRRVNFLQFYKYGNVSFCQGEQEMSKQMDTPLIAGDTLMMTRIFRNGVLGELYNIANFLR